MRVPADAPADDRLERWLAAHRARILSALLVGAVFVRLLLCLQIAAGPIPRIHDFLLDTDGRFFDVWAKHLAAGDWLQREPLHPMTTWMEQVADAALSDDPGLPARLGLAADGQLDRPTLRARLWSHWMRGRTYYQEPLYAYLVALTYRLTGDDPWHVFAWQLALGVLAVLLVHALARRLFSESAAVAAGLLAVLAPIPLGYEVVLLRDGLIAVVTLALAMGMRWAAGGSRRRWLALGVAFGLAACLKVTFLLFPVALGLWRLAFVRARLRDRLVPAAAVLAGVALGLAPVVARNVGVGAAPLGLTGASPAMFPAYQIVSASPFDMGTGDELSRVLVASDGGLLSSIAPAAGTFPTAWGLPLLALRKALYAWHGYEAPNNVDFYVLRQGAPLLAALPITFVVLVVLAGIGIATRAAGRAWPLLVAIAASLPTLVMGADFSRYRAAIALALLPIAGAGVVRVVRWARDRRWRAALIAAIPAAAYAAWATGDPPGLPAAERASAYALRGRGTARAGEPALASLYFKESLRLVPDQPWVEAALGRSLLAARDPEAALAHLDAALRRIDDPRVRRLRAQALAGTGRTAEAEAEERAAAAQERATSPAPAQAAPGPAR